MNATTYNHEILPKGVIHMNVKSKKVSRVYMDGPQQCELKYRGWSKFASPGIGLRIFELKIYGNHIIQSVAKIGYVKKNIKNETLFMDHEQLGKCINRTLYTANLPLSG